MWQRVLQRPDATYVRHLLRCADPQCLTFQLPFLAHEHRFGMVCKLSVS